MNKKILVFAKRYILVALLICITVITIGCGEAKKPSGSESVVSSETDTSSSDINESSKQEEDTSSDDTSSENNTPVDVPSSPTESTLTINDVAFIGDSRTLSMAHGGRLEYSLIPDSSVFATWGGKLTDDSAKINTQSAANADKKMAIFWYGINDVQGNPSTRDDASLFLSNYKVLIDLYRSTNPDSDIVILSILTTSIHERDYYDKQEENIRAYNAKLSTFCKENGYTYLDLTSLYTGDTCFAEGDYIHFSKEWYENAFIPSEFNTLKITNTP